LVKKKKKKERRKGRRIYSANRSILHEQTGYKAT
jgi:hypothetical protein